VVGGWGKVTKAPAPGTQATLLWESQGGRGGGAETSGRCWEKLEGLLAEGGCPRKREKKRERLVVSYEAAQPWSGAGGGGFKVRLGGGGGGATSEGVSMCGVVRKGLGLSFTFSVKDEARRASEHEFLLGEEELDEPCGGAGASLAEAPLGRPRLRKKYRRKALATRKKSVLRDLNVKSYRQRGLAKKQEFVSLLSCPFELKSNRGFRREEINQA